MAAAAFIILSRTIGGTKYETFIHETTSLGTANFQVDQRTIAQPLLNFWLFYLTHLGGATSAIGINVLIWALSPQPLRTTGLQALTALAVSHLPVAVAKSYTRACALIWRCRERIRFIIRLKIILSIRSYYSYLRLNGTLYGGLPCLDRFPAATGRYCRFLPNLFGTALPF